jgi:predicted nucleotidyltransferase
MRIQAALDAVVTSPTKLKLLRTLIASPNRQRTGRELATAAGVSSAQAARDLHSLLDVGIVRVTSHGRSFAWSWNPRHVLAGPLSDLLGFENSIRGELSHEIALGLVGLPIRRARLFGSVARGDERADSDVDLFLEVKGQSEKSRVEAALPILQERIWNRFGNPLTTLVYSAADVDHPRNPGLLVTIDVEGVDVPVEEGSARVAHRAAA